jgi:NAD(P)H-dependent FMN reductase
MERTLRTGIIVGSTRQNRQGERVAAWARSLAAERPEIEPVVVDLKEWPLPFYDQPKPPKALEASYESDLARRWVKTLEGLDAS